MAQKLGTLAERLMMRRAQKNGWVSPGTKVNLQACQKLVSKGYLQDGPGPRYSLTEAGKTVDASEPRIDDSEL